MTIKDFVKYFVEELAVLEWYDAREVRAMAGRLLLEVAGVPSYKIVVEPQMELDEMVVRRLEEITAELATGRPLQYVLGYEMFYGHRFSVGEGVLIPRPETEELVRMVVDEIHQLYKYIDKTESGQLLGSLAFPLRIMDICTGSGCIAWSIASALDGLPIKENLAHTGKVWGCDISDDALAIAAGQKIYSVAGHIEDFKHVVPQFFKCDILADDAQDLIANNIEGCTLLSGASIPEEHKLDIIISNPPYVCEREKLLMRSNVLDFEPGCALFVPDDNPLLFYRRIAELGCGLLKKRGRLYFETNERFAQHTANMLEENGFADCRVINDLFGKPRFVTAIYM